MSATTTDLPLVERLTRLRTSPDTDVYDMFLWEKRDASITGQNGEVIFEQRGVEVPATWSQLATNIVASKYFRGHLDATGREWSVRQLVKRVVNTLTVWAERGGYFIDQAEKYTFRDELAFLMLSQRAAFNSPVWFNVGVDGNDGPAQCSACFINSVEDDMESIMELAATEARLFKGGSGAGVNLSKLRAKCEGLTGGGTASGPVSFMRGYDAFAGVVKSGGKTRRAAKMVILDIDHPDIHEFINCKAEEEQKAWALIDAGYDGSFNGPAYSSVFFQNANHSVRVTDEFMRAVEEDRTFDTVTVRDGVPIAKYSARNTWEMIAAATHLCGDPGLQFDDTIQRWHTCPNTDRINASNPCSEYLFLDDTACNLASLNLLKYRLEDGSFSHQEFEHDVDLLIFAMDAIVEGASYPTERISLRAKATRTLGLGYANLGALLMQSGLPYDSEEGRDLAAAITSLMCGRAYRQSALLAQRLGPFEYYPENSQPMRRVIRMHATANKRLRTSEIPKRAAEVWNDAIRLGDQNGFRNAQATVLAPTGTIGFMMDCDTTGVEPDIALVKYKKLVGGGVMRITNQSVEPALRELGYGSAINAILRYIERTGTIEGAPYMQSEDLKVFDCAFKPEHGTRSISYTGHIRMMGAVQPFISGAISKTVNLPHDATVEDIMAAYKMSWELGLKAVALYRDGCKRLQPLNTSQESTEVVAEDAPLAAPSRVRMPDTRSAVTHKFSIGGHKGYFTVGLYDDGRPGELFITMSKQGSTIAGLVDSIAVAVSIGLQHGVPLETYCKKFIHSRFEPSGWTDNPEISFAKSIVDYIFRWLSLRFLDDTPVLDGGEVLAAEDMTPEVETISSHGPPCHVCGTITTPNGSCHRCPNCGATTGCS